MRKILLFATMCLMALSMSAQTLFETTKADIAVVKGCDVDQPRNLAKSVTVE